MRRTTRLIRVLLVTTIACAIAVPAFSGPPAETLRLSVRPALELRAGGYAVDLFGTGGGVSLAAGLPLPFFPIVGLGVELGYHFVPVMGNEVTDPFSVSVFTAALEINARWIFFSRLETSLELDAGWFFGMINEPDAATGNGFAGVAGIAVGYLITDSLSVDVGVRSAQLIGLDGKLEIAVGTSLRW